MYYLFSLCPSGLNVILLLFRYFNNTDNLLSAERISNYQKILNVFVVPVFLIILNIYFIFKKKIKWYTSIIFNLLVIIINGSITYLSWGISTGQLLNPDPETTMYAIYFDTVFPIIITLFGMGMFGIFNLVKKIVKSSGEKI